MGRLRQTGTRRTARLAITSLTVRTASSPGTSPRSITPKGSITLNDVDNAKTYVIAVRAKNSGGGSGWRDSAPAGPYTPPTPEPTPAPALVAENVTATDATLVLGNWNQSWYYRTEETSNSGGARAFGASAQTNCNGPVQGTQTTVTGLTPNSRYSYGAYANAQCSEAVAAGAMGASFNTAQAQAQSSSVRLTAHSIASTSLALNIEGHTTAWYYQWQRLLNKSKYSEGTCAAVTAGTSSVDVTSLTQGTEYRFKAYSDSGCSTELTDDLTDLNVSTHGLVLNATYLLVPENDTYPHTVRLATEPLASVTVAITTSGDADITADTDTGTTGNQTTLTFTTSNWDEPQTVTLAAADDTDAVPQAGKGDGAYAYGDATLTYTATSADANYDGVSTTLTAEEADDDVCQGTAAVGNATTGDLVKDCNLLLPGKDLINGGGGVVNDWDTGKAMGSWKAIEVKNSRVVRIFFVWSLYAGQSGNLPNTVGKLTELTHLEMQSGDRATTPMPIPEGLDNLTKLDNLKVYNGRWAGEIPSGIGNLTLMEELYVDKNYLSGPIPSTLGNLTSLTKVYLDNDGLAGQIPESLGNLTSVTTLTMFDGDLTGHIPASLGNLTSLSSSYGLILKGNRLTGCIPTSLDAFKVNDRINPQRDAAGNDVTLAVCTDGVGVSDSSVVVGEGGYVDVGVRLLTAPTNGVTVNIASSGGDSDIAVDTDTILPGNQSSLSFTTSNWGTPQTMRISAGADSDKLTGSKTFTLTTTSADSDYSGKTAAVAASENDIGATVSALGITSTSAILNLAGHTGWHYKQDFPQGDSSCNAVSSTSTIVHGLQPDETYRFGAYLDADCSEAGRVDDATFTTALADLTNIPCVKDGVTTLWPGYACHLKAGAGGIQSFDSATLEGNGATLVELTQFAGIGVTEVMAYNPKGGTATLKTTLNGAARDTFTINVVRFGIREFSVSKKSAGANDTFTLTVKLNSPSHRSPNKYATNSTNLARSSVQLTLPSNSGLTGNDHARSGGVANPVQVVNHFGDTVTFTISTGATTGTFDIDIKAYNPAPESSCPLAGDPTQGAIRCYAPPVGSATLSYTVE